MKNLLATLLLSQGTPMLLAGDEFGRTQQGNNNAYCQDNEISWVDWNHEDRAERLINFVRKLIGRCAMPILRRALPHRRIQRGARGQGRHLDQRRRRGDARGALEGPARALLRHAARRPRAGDRHPRRGEDATLLIIFNPWQDVVKFKLPPSSGGNGWTLRADTNFPDSTEGRALAIGHEYEVTGALAAAAQLP